MGIHEKRKSKITVIEKSVGILRKSPDKHYHIPENEPIYYSPEFPNRIKTIKKITLKNSKRMVVEIITLGARIVTIKVPDKNYHFENIVLDFEQISDYLKEECSFFNCIVGRVAGPNQEEKNNQKTIANNSSTSSSSFSLISDLWSSEYSINDDICGFDKVIWESKTISDGVILSYHSKDGQMGFSGNVVVNICYRINHENKLFIDISAMADDPTPINITQIINMNLAGYYTGVDAIKNHIVTMNTDRIIETTDNLQPTGRLAYIKNSPFDLRIPRQLDGVVYDIPGGGFDHFFRTNGTRSDGLRFIGRIIHPRSGRTLEIFSNQPCFSLYTGGRLPVPMFKHISEPYPCQEEGLKKERDGDKCVATLLADLVPLIPNEEKYIDPSYKISDAELLRHGFFKGKNGCRYNHLGTFAVVPSWFPLGMDKDSFPQNILKPSKTYKNSIEYHFGITRREQYGKIYGEEVISLPSEEEEEDDIPLLPPE